MSHGCQVGYRDIPRAKRKASWAVGALEPHSRSAMSRGLREGKTISSYHHLNVFPLLHTRIKAQRPLEGFDVGTCLST